MKFAHGRFFLLGVKANALQAVKRMLYCIQQRHTAAGENEMKAIAIKTSSKTGKRFALCPDGDAFGVWVECKNYAAHVRGGIAITWRYVAKGLDRAAAEKLLNRRAA